MMKHDKTQFLVGFILGLIVCAIGVFTFLHFVAKIDLSESIYYLSLKKLFGKVLAIGCVLNLVLFFGILKLEKEFMARGVIMSVIMLAIISVFL